MKKLNIKIFVAFIFFIFLVPAAFASIKDRGSINLLALSEITEEVYKGSIANLELEIRPGSGMVFVNTFPISKLDTQISMRFAKQIACKHSKKDCSKYDFIYTLKASSGIVGGPSAGAAAAVLTTSLLENLELDKKIAITGTINSGELIGPVGGLKEKIDAAALNGIKKVLIPKWGVPEEINENKTVDLIQHGKDLGLEVIKISTLDEAMFQFTGKIPEKIIKELSVDQEYIKIMKSLAEMLCERSEYLNKNYLSETPVNDIDDSIFEYDKSALNSTKKAVTAFEEGDYYTAASYCFRANINYRYLWYYIQNLTSKKILNLTSYLKNEIDSFEEEIDNKPLKTLTDLQAYMITKERFAESRERIGLVMKNINNTETASYLLAFARERLFSAFTWSHFFNAGGQRFKLDNESLKNSCEIKISEAEERHQFVNFYLSSGISETRKVIDRANSARKKGNYIVCLFEASRAKAQANVILSVMGVDKDRVNEMLNQKLDAAEQTIIEQQENGIFPIMGYSYFEYAKSLAKDDASSSMIYAEYALELSNFDFYFEKKGFFDIMKNNYNYNPLLLLVMGICLGILIGSRLKKSKKSKTVIRKIPKTKHNIRIRKARK